MIKMKKKNDKELVLVIIGKENYEKELISCIGKLNGRKKIGYFCLSRPYSYVIDDLENKGVNIDNYYFVDILSSHYSLPEPKDNCMFLTKPCDIDLIESALRVIIEEKKCGLIIFDNLMMIEMAHERESILKFANNLIMDSDFKKVMKVLVVLDYPDNDYFSHKKELLDDLKMFAHNIIKRCTN